jgi:hypothetical protein
MKKTKKSEASQQEIEPGSISSTLLNWRCVWVTHITWAYTMLVYDTCVDWPIRTRAQK